MKIYIVNCGLSYIFRGVEGCEVLNCNARMSLLARFKNRISSIEEVPEDMTKYEKLSDADHVIFFADTKRFISRCRHIEDAVRDSTKLHLYLWNPLNYYADLIDAVSDRWYIWTFSKEEARNNDMLYADTFYNKLLVEEAQIETDLFFVGLNKGRKSLLETLKQVARDEGLVADINIVDGVRCWFDKSYAHKMPYEEVRHRIARTKALIDIAQEGQSGLSQRVMESLFYHKKLITNNFSVAKMPFYNKSNIFLIGQDDIHSIKQFVIEPYMDIGFDIEMFNVREWLSRIIDCKEFYAG